MNDSSVRLPSEAAQVANKTVGAQGSFEWVCENTVCLVANMPVFFFVVVFSHASAYSTKMKSAHHYVRFVRL